MKNDFKQLVDRNLSGLQWDGEHRQRVRLALDSQGGITMKRKFTVILAAALVLVMTASAALAATLLNYSPVASALTQARNVLMAQYGLTHTTLGLFTHDLYMLEGATVVVYHSDVVDAYGSGLTGEYTVTIPDGGEAIACWTFDHVPASIWQSGGMDAPIWGQPQLEKFLQDQAAGGSGDYTANLDESGVTYVVTNTSEPSAETELVEINMTAAEPGPGDLSESEALAMARAALMETFALSESDMDKANFIRCELEQCGGYTTRTWQMDAQLPKNGCIWNLYIVIDSQTGEIMDIGMSTGNAG